MERYDYRVGVANLNNHLYNKMYIERRSGTEVVTRMYTLNNVIYDFCYSHLYLFL